MILYVQKMVQQEAEMVDKGGHRTIYTPRQTCLYDAYPNLFVHSN